MIYNLDSPRRRLDLNSNEEHSKSATACVYYTAHSQDGILTYLVPYLPVTPTFLVRLVILADVAWMNCVMEVGSRRLDVDF